MSMNGTLLRQHISSGGRAVYLLASQGNRRLGVRSNASWQEAQLKDPAVTPLFSPFKIGPYELQTRMVYPPLTRLRATPACVPTPIMVTYYGQRANPGGLVIAEGTYISPESNGYPCAPGVWSAEQVEAWKPVVQAVHDKKAVFFCQLWHCGRASHPALQPGGKLPIAPSAIAIGSGYQVTLPDFTQAAYPVPQALTKEGIQEVVGQYAAAAKNAVAAGFDGVEIHGATGYLVEEFLRSGTNKRTDEYGGSIENRCRFALEVVGAVAAAIGEDKVGLRLSPFSDFLDTACDPNDTPYTTYMYLVEQLRRKHPRMAYLHMVEARVQGNVDVEQAADSLVPFRKVWPGPFIVAGGYKAHSAAEAVASGHADFVAFGRWWLANPDLPKRFKLGAPLNKYDRNTFYGAPQPATGYTDYPLLEEVKV